MSTVHAKLAIKLAGAGAVAAVGGAMWDTLPVARWRVQRVTSEPWEGVKLEPGSYQQNACLESALDSHLRNKPVGLHILCAPRGSGKTATLAHVLRKAREDGRVSGLLVLDHKTVRFPLWMRAMNAVAPAHMQDGGRTVDTAAAATLGSFHPVEKVLPQDSVVVIDDAENFSANDQHFKDRLYSLAKQGAQGKNFKTFVVVHDPVLALELHAINAHNKVKLVKPQQSPTFALPKPQCKALASVLGRNRGMDAATLHKFTRDAVTSQTPGFVVENAEAYRAGTVPASLHDAALTAASQWRTWQEQVATWRD